MMTIPDLTEHDLLRLRNRALSTTGLSVLIADARIPDLPLVDVNSAFEQMTGYRAVEVIGRNCRFLQGPGTDPDAVRRMRRAIEDKQAITEVLLNYRKDGTPFWNEVNVSPVLDSSGTVTHFVGLQHDVTQRERGNQQLQLLAETSERLASRGAIEDVLPEIAQLMVPSFADYCTIHLRGDANAAVWISTAGVDDGVAREIGDIERSFPHCPEENSGIATVMRTGRPLLRRARSEAMLSETARNDTHRQLLEQQAWKATMIVPIKAFENVFGTIHLSHVRSGFSFTADEFNVIQEVGSSIGSRFEHNRLLEAEKSALADRERFLSIAAHELRTPVASIQGFTQLLSRSLDRDTLTPMRLRQAIDALNASVARLSGLTDDLLDMSHRGAQELPLTVNRVHVPSYLESVASRSALLYANPIVVSSDAFDGYVTFDITRVDQVMSNVMSNAAKYSDSSRPITLGAEPDWDGVRITVQDLGIGLSEDELESIFELFATTPGRESGKIPGLGLGLYTARNIIERHGGKLWAESAGRGHGSRINIWLPTEPAPSSQVDTPPG